jgi:WD40 repeat protein
MAIGIPPVAELMERIPGPVGEDKLLALRLISPVHSQDVPGALTFSPDEARVAWGGNWLAHVWNPTAGLPPHGLERDRGKINGFALRPDGRRLATASEDSTALVCDVSK